MHALLQSKAFAAVHTGGSNVVVVVQSPVLCASFTPASSHATYLLPCPLQTTSCSAARMSSALSAWREQTPLTCVPI